jgi:hypothetical protein
MKKALIYLIFLFFISCETPKQNPTNPDNKPPIIDSVSVIFDLISTVPIADITCYAHDPDGDSLTYKWKATAGELVGSGKSVKYIVAPCCDSITNKITVEVFDIYNAHSSYTFPIKPVRK